MGSTSTARWWSICGAARRRGPHRAVGRDTITNVFSTTKTMTAWPRSCWSTAASSTSTPRRPYWPEFAATGKEGVKVRHLLSHTSGVSGWDQPIVIEDLYDWEKSTARLAAQAPWWEPGRPRATTR